MAHEGSPRGLTSQARDPGPEDRTRLPPQHPLDHTAGSLDPGVPYGTFRVIRDVVGRRVGPPHLHTMCHTFGDDRRVNPAHGVEGEEEASLLPQPWEA